MKSASSQGRESGNDHRGRTHEFNPYRKALECKALARCGWDECDIATQLKLKAHDVELLLTLAGAPRQIRTRLETGSLSAVAALDSLRTHGWKAFDLLVRMATDEGSANNENRAGPADAGDAAAKTHIRRLLGVLEAHGELDADRLEQITGIKKPIIVSTLFLAKGRGQVQCTPKAVRLKEAGVLEQQRRTPRGQMYSFLSYKATSTPRAVADIEAAKAARHLSELADLLFCGDLKKVMRTYDAITKPRRVCLAGFH